MHTYQYLFQQLTILLWQNIQPHSALIATVAQSRRFRIHMSVRVSIRVNVKASIFKSISTFRHRGRRHFFSARTLLCFNNLVRTNTCSNEPLYDDWDKWQLIGEPCRYSLFSSGKSRQDCSAPGEVC